MTEDRVNFFSTKHCWSVYLQDQLKGKSGKSGVCCWQGLRVAGKYRSVCAMLGATGNSEAKNVESVMFFKMAWLVEASGHFDFTSDEQYGGISWFYELFGRLQQRLYPVEESVSIFKILLYYSVCYYKNN